MARLTIIKQDEKQEIELENIGSWLFENSHTKDSLLKGFKFYKEVVSHSTSATVEDLFSGKDITAVQIVGGDVAKRAAKIGAQLQYAVFNPYYGTKKILNFFKTPKTAATTTGAANNALSERSNEVRLGARIEDIWGTEYTAYPSLLGSYFRFDSDLNEIECSIMCLGVGKYSTSDALDGGYPVVDVATTAMNFYEGGVSISGTPSYTLTPGTSIKYSPLAVIKNTTVSSVALYPDTTGAVIFANNYGQNQLLATPYITILTRSVNDSYIGTVTAKITCSSIDWTEESFAEGGKITFEGWCHADSVTAGTYWPDCSTLTAYVTLATTTELYFTLTYQTSSSLDKAWDKFPLLTATAPIWRGWTSYNIGTDEDPVNVTDVFATPIPPGYAYPGDIQLITDPRCAILRPASYQSSAITVEYTNTVANYLLNYVAESGTAGGSNTVIITTEWSDDTETTAEYVFAKDSSTTTRRVGYTQTLSFSNTVSPYAVSFKVHRKVDTGDVFTLRDVYRTFDYTDWYDSGANPTTIIRCERKYNSIYGSSGDLKLSMTATRKVHPVIVSGDSWSLDTTTLEANNKFDVVLANLHLDKYNGRRTTSSLSYNSLLTARQEIVSALGADYANIGITFDDSSSKYEDEVNEILYGVNCNSYQVGSKIYVDWEQPQSDIYMQFTHRDIIPGTLQISRVFRKENDYDGIQLTYKDYDTKESTILYMPDDGSITNPYEIETTSVHTVEQANVRLYREYYKLLYKRKSCEFESNSLGRIVVPGMLISVADSTREVKTDGELLSTYTTGGYLYGTTSQPVPDGVDHIILTAETGEAYQYSCVKVDDYTIKFTTTPSITITTGWEQNKTQYRLVSGTTYQKWLVDDVESSGYDSVKISCVNYDSRYYTNG